MKHNVWRWKRILMRWGEGGSIVIGKNGGNCEQPEHSSGCNGFDVKTSFVQQTM